MRTSLKAALAGVAGVGLLLGGAGSLAFWADEEDIPSAVITSGKLELGSPDCSGGWSLGTAAFDPAVHVIVPGDTLTRVCTMTISASGSVKADLTMSTPSDGTGALADEIKYEATYTLGGTAFDPATASPDFTAAQDGKVLEATTKVTFPFGTLDNDSNSATEFNATKVQATLAAITITATQTS